MYWCICLYRRIGICLWVFVFGYLSLHLSWYWHCFFVYLKDPSINPLSYWGRRTRSFMEKLPKFQILHSTNSSSFRLEYHPSSQLGRFFKNLCWTRQIVFNLLDVFSGIALVKASMDSGIDVRICKFCWFCLKDKKRKREQTISWGLFPWFLITSELA